MFQQFTVREFLLSFVAIAVAMVVGVLIAIDFHSNPFACAATGAIVALGFIAERRYTISHKQT